jgi:hypothetical protein
MNVINISATSFRQNIFKLLNEVVSEDSKIIIERPGGDVVIQKEITSGPSSDVFSKVPYLDAVAGGVTDKDLIYHNLVEWNQEPNINPKQ